MDRAPFWGIVNGLAYAIVYDVYETFVSERATHPELKHSGQVSHFLEWVKRRGMLDDNELRLYS